MMKEHLHVAVESGTVEKLRTLAGGERKIGDLLTDVVNMLWRHRSTLEGARLQDLMLAGPDDLGDLGDRLRRLEEKVTDLEKANAR